MAFFAVNLHNMSVLDNYKFPGIFDSIPRKLLENSPESSLTFPGIFSNIS